MSQSGRQDRMRKLYGTYTMMVATAFFWGSNFVAGKYLVGLVQPFTIAVLRFSIASLCLAVYAVVKQGWPRNLGVKPLLLLAVLGLVGTFLANGLVFPALQYSTAINGSLIMALIPAATALMAFVLLREPLRLGNILSIIVSFSGVVLVLLQGQDLGHLKLNLGDWLFLLAMLCGALNYILVKVALKYFTPLFITAGSLFFGSLLMLPFALQEIGQGQTLNLPFKVWVLILYMALVTTSLGFYFWNSGIGRLGPARASIFFNLIPVFAVILSAAFLDETVTSGHLAGLSFIIGGIAGNQWFSSQAKQGREPFSYRG